LKKRDIFILILSVFVIAVAGFFLMRMIFPPKDNTAITEEANKIPAVPATIDETTYEGVENLSDYGAANLTKIGKTDLFGAMDAAPAPLPVAAPKPSTEPLNEADTDDSVISE
jgi:hypothetical protein